MAFSSPGHEVRPAAPAGGRGRTVGDLALVGLLVAAVVGVSAHGPSHTYAYAQLWQIGAAMDVLENGRWLVPRDQQGIIFRKPQLYVWLEAAVLKLTGVYHDLVFRLPTIAASLAMGAMVYFLGRRWYGRRVGLLAACLWATAMHMSKLMYMALTDMLLAAWLTAAVMCADRLLFHPARRGRRRRWAVGFWGCMILAALTKSWGIINLAVVGLMVAMATGLGGGFKALRAARHGGDQWVLAVRLVLRRWWRAMKALRLGWGLLAFAAVLGPVLVGMFLEGGEEFRQIVHFEIWQRLTGEGRAPPRPGAMPPIVYLLYYTLPVSVFAVAAVLLARLRVLLSRRSPLFLPLCWIVAVLVPFSLAHGFRPDYLLPCYAAMALMGAWGLQALAEARRQGIVGRVLRRLCAAVPVAIGAGLILLSCAYLLHDRMPPWVTERLKLPARVPPETWRMLGGVIALGGGVMIAGVWAAARGRVKRSAAATIVAMLGVMFLDTHMISRLAARTGDGEKMLAFARQARREVGDGDVCFYMADRLCPQVYMGQLGYRVPMFIPGVKETPVQGARRVIGTLTHLRAPWLVTSSRGLVRLGATRIDPEGEYGVPVRRRVVRMAMVPEDLGEPRVIGEPVEYQAWGRPYLIRLKPTIRPSGVPRVVGYVSGDPE